LGVLIVVFFGKIQFDRAGHIELSCTSDGTHIR
jgi:hypothetical protein